MDKIRAVAFGANRFGVALVTEMPKRDGCGIYIHVDDIQKYLAEHSEAEVMAASKKLDKALESNKGE